MQFLDKGGGLGHGYFILIGFAVSFLDEFAFGKHIFVFNYYQQLKTIISFAIGEVRTTRTDHFGWNCQVNRFSFNIFESLFVFILHSSYEIIK